MPTVFTRNLIYFLYRWSSVLYDRSNLIEGPTVVRGKARHAIEPPAGKSVAMGLVNVIRLKA